MLTASGIAWCSDTRLGVVACEIFEKELELLLKDYPEVVHKEYLEFGLHICTKELKNTVIEKVNALEGKVDSVFLGYGYCQSLKGITEQLRVPTVMLETDDCIGVLLTPSEYESEKKICTGTWFNSPFWAEMGIARQIKELHIDKMKNPRHEPMWFIRKFFEGYSRCLYVDTGVGERDRYEALSMEFARELGLRHESRDGTLRLLIEGLDSAKRLASSR
jgi:hypothetical protein